MNNLEKTVRRFPRLPGVYLMKDGRGQVLYVGKAKDLRARVLNYFRPGADSRPTVPHLLARVRRIEFIAVDNEKEAFLLENHLLKEYRPPYNIFFRDDKDFYSLRIDPSRNYPRLELVRRPRADGALYFGPYSSAAAMRSSLKYFQSLFPLRRCSENVFRHRRRPCLYHQMGRCPAPCAGLISPEEYRLRVNELVLFLRGKKKELLVSLRRKMKRESAALDFEEAGRTLERIRAIEETLEEQKISRVEEAGRDVFALAREGAATAIQALFVRRGKLVGGRSDFFPGGVGDDSEILESYLSQFYRRGGYVPAEILLPRLPSQADILQSFLESERGGRVLMKVPRRGPKRKLLEMAAKNARLALAAGLAGEKGEGGLAETKRALKLKNTPRTLEAFDVSNLSGREAVGSMAVFRDGEKFPSSYRRYRIKTVAGADDYAMLAEVIRRRYLRAGEIPPPDLILIDGGRGQLETARQVLAELKIARPDVAAIAKEKSERGAKTPDRVYLAGRKGPLVLPAGSPALRLLQRARDEAHRFARAYHLKLRKKDFLKSGSRGKRK